ncbi:hypothetical protein VST7929_01595 [Vibrio stylophorae]|uniref:Card1 endonuclease domain-containing protein n=1 Tax=Vibrio stylophorae TaxID=659351 RepID=A0ABN8DSD3_9VIBR|nr:DUF1887 family CARF protein [Vibrio stylophorae]CAH0533720.1 hypothetical protein VST7929_01595 [Vibrio stylophorae]
MTTHIGILDADPVRLITPILDNGIPASRLILIGESKQLADFERMQAILVQRQVECEFFEISDTIRTSELQAQISVLAQRLMQSQDPVWFNASCGLRHRLLSAYEVFRSIQCPIYVVEPFTDAICWLYPQEMQQKQVQDHIQLADYLSIFGARCEIEEPNISAHDAQQLMLLCHAWANNALELGPGLATLNYLATTCRKEQVLSVELSEKQQGYRELAMLINDLMAAKLATYKQGMLTFRDEFARRFANGEWLETFVHGTVKKIQQVLPTIQDNSIGVQVYRQIGEKEVRNELDVAAIVNNKLHIIECKTKGMNQDGDDTLYKLESIRDLLGGLQARAMLVSFRPLRGHDMIRAEDLGLEIIGPEQLGDLEHLLHRWFVDARGQDFL